MNKGIIIEVRKGFSIVLSDGEFIRVVNKKSMEVGMTILFTEEDVIRRTYRYNIRQSARKYGSVAAAFVAVLFMSLMFYNNNYAVYSVVTMDINPSVEVFLNRDDEVLRLEALNEDGLVFEDMDIKGLGLEAAIEALVVEAQVEGYIDEDGYETATIVFTAVPMRGGKEEAVTIVNKIEEVILEAEGFEDMNVAVTDSSKEKLKEAEESETPLPLIELEVNLDEIDTVKALFEDEAMVESLTANGKVKTNNGNAFGKDKDDKEVGKKVGQEEPDEKIVLMDDIEDEASDEEADSNGSDDVDDEKLDETKKQSEEKQGPSYGNSLETRGDLNEIVIKLQWILDNYPPTSDSGDSVLVRIHTYIDGVSEAIESEDFDFDFWKRSGQDLLKQLREEGVKYSDDDPEEERNREQEEEHGGNYDEDKDYDHDRDQDRDSQEDEEDEEEEDEEDEEDERDDDERGNNGNGKKKGDDDD